MPTNRYRSSVVKVKQTAPTTRGTDRSDPITEETVDGIAPTGYFIRGVLTPTRVPMQLKEGDRVAVQWRRGSPFMILTLRNRRGPGSDENFPGGGIVEVLFVAPRLADGVVDVHFRNDQQTTPLKVRELLSGDPVAVRWGANERSFVVQVGDPGPMDFWNEYVTFDPFVVHTPLRPVQDQTFHVFTMRGTDRKILGSAKPKVTLAASYSPVDSAVEMIHVDGDITGSSFSRRNAVDEGGDVLSLSYVGFDDGEASGGGAGGDLIVPLSDLLTLVWGPCEIADFGLDRKNHLLLNVRARTDLSITVTVNSSGFHLNDPGDTACSFVHNAFSVSGGTPMNTLPGEGHTWVVDMTEPAVKFRTNEEATTLIDHSALTGAMDLDLTLAHNIDEFGGCGTGFIPFSTTPSGGVTYTDVGYGLLGGGAYEKKSSMWDVARFAFIPPGTLDVSGFATAGATQDAYASIETTGVHLSFSEPSALSAPELAHRTYYVRNVAMLKGPQTEAHALRLFVCVYRENLNAAPPGLQYSAYVVELDGTIVRTLKDWTDMQTFNTPTFPDDPPVPFSPYEINDVTANTVHDGGEARLVSGNWEHVLWEYSTLAERSASPDTRHVVLTQLSTGDEIAVGVDFSIPKFYDFRVLNLDVMYALAPDSKPADPDRKIGHFFVKAWATKTGKPTLDETVDKYPLEDTQLKGVAVLKRIDPDKLVVDTSDAQGINDTGVLSSTGRKLKPTPGDKGE